VLVNGAGAGAVDATEVGEPGAGAAAPLLPRLAEGIETAMASICAFRALAPARLVSLSFTNCDIVSSRFFLALTMSSSP